MLRQILSKTLKRSILPCNLRAAAYSSKFVNSQDGSENKQSNVQQTEEILNHSDIPIIDYDDPDHWQLPGYAFKPNEPMHIRKARLLYQSRKRGMLENDLLLSTFAAKFLKDLTAEQTEQYDQLINGVSNDWDIYYWATENKPTPAEYDNEIMRMLKQHVKNVERETRLRMPNL